MAVVDDIRALGVLDARVSEVVRSVEDAHLSPHLVAKAAATFGLPNLLQRSRASSNSQCSERYQERCDRSGAGIVKTDSCCSCTPLACRPDRRNAEDGTCNFVRPPSSSTVFSCPASRDVRNEEVFGEKEQINGDLGFFERTDTFPHSVAGSQISTICDITADDTGGRYLTMTASEDWGEKEREEEKNVRDTAMQEHSPNDCTEEEMALLDKKEDDNDKQISAGEINGGRREVVPVKQQSTRATYWRRVADYEKEWTFRPKLNHVSLRLAAQAARSSLPVAHRLYERRTQSITSLHESFTFCPKLNAASLRLAEERAQRLPEVSEILPLSSQLQM